MANWKPYDVGMGLATFPTMQRLSLALLLPCLMIACSGETPDLVVYCALDAGILARYFGADVSIEMTSFSRDVAEAYVDS